MIVTDCGAGVEAIAEYIPYVVVKAYESHIYTIL